MTAITKMFLPSSYSLTKNSHLCCIVHTVRSVQSSAKKFLLGSTNIIWLTDSQAPEGSHGVTRWHHVASLFAKSLAKSYHSVCMRLLSCVREMLGCPATVLCFKVSITLSLNLEMRSFSWGNMILTLNQVWSTVSRSTLNHTRNITHSPCLRTLCVSVCARVHVFVWLHIMV